MASAITHFIVGAAIALPAIESPSIRQMLRPWLIPVSAGLWAAAPDLDTFLMGAFQIPYASFFGHRGFFHSPLFLAIAAAILARRAALTAWWAVAAITHPLLDALTDGGLGVMLLFPFSTRRYFFPWRPIHVSPLGIGAFFDEAGYILGSELPFCAAALAFGIAVYLIRRSVLKVRERALEKEA